MRLLLNLFILITIITASLSIAAGEKQVDISSPTQNIELYKIKSEMLIIKQSIQEIRRDQINYRIEKDLLKEAYSTNVQTINIIITLILALFTIIGFVGVKSIGSIKDDFRNELNDLKRLKIKYEDKFTEIDEHYKRSKEDMEKIRVVNEDQGTRLKLLEVQEKVGALMSNKNFSRALTYVSAGLYIDENDIVLLSQKSQCLMKLGHFQEAIDVLKKLKGLEPDATWHVANIAELYLLLRRVDLYNDHIKKFSELILEKYPSKLIWYYELIRLYVEGDGNKMKTHVQNGISENDNEKSKPLNSWQFDEVRFAFNNDPYSENKKLLFNTIEVLDAKITGANLRANIDD